MNADALGYTFKQIPINLRVDIDLEYIAGLHYMVNINAN